MKKVDQKKVQAKRTVVTAAHRRDEVIETATKVEQPSAVPAPTEAAPLVPTGFVPLKGRALKLGILTKTQIVGAQGLADDMAAADPADFGPDAPSLSNLATLLGVAGEWSTERIHAEAWREYSRTQEVRAWGPALAELDALKDTYAYRVKRDPKFAEKYPSLALFYALRRRTSGKKKTPASTPPATPTNTQGQSNG